VKHPAHDAKVGRKRERVEPNWFVFSQPMRSKSLFIPVLVVSALALGACSSQRPHRNCNCPQWAIETEPATIDAAESHDAIANAVVEASMITAQP